jgi:hypothetical protein
LAVSAAGDFAGKKRTARADRGQLTVFKNLQNVFSENLVRSALSSGSKRALGVRESVPEWRAIQDKTANSYTIEIALYFEPPPCPLRDL